MDGRPGALLIGNALGEWTTIADRLVREFPELQIEEVPAESVLQSKLRKGEFDMAIVDYHLRWRDSLSLLCDIKLRHPMCTVIMLTDRDEDRAAARSMPAGADACVSSAAERSAQLLLAVRSALRFAELRKVPRASDAHRYPSAGYRASGHFSITDDGNVVGMDSALLEMLLYPDTESLPGGSIACLFPSTDDYQRLMRLLERHGSVRGYETQLHRSDGRFIWVRFSGRSVVKGDARHYIGVLEDITERKQAEESLDRYRLLSQHASDIILFVRQDWRIIEANDAAAKAYGYTRDELLHMDVRELRAPGHGADIGTQIRESQADGMTFQTVHRRKSGEVFPVEVSARSATIGGKPILLSIIRDITARKRAEERIRQHNKDLGMLNSIAASLSVLLELPEMLYRLEQIMVQELGITMGRLLSYHEAEDALRPQFSWGYEDALLTDGGLIPVSHSDVEPIIRNKEVMVVTRPGSDRAMALQDTSCCLGIPLLSEGDVQGVLELYGDTVSASNDRMAFYSALGQQIGMAVQKARLYEQLLTNNERLQSLSRRLVNVQESERRNIARELHDEVGAMVTALSLALGRRSPAGGATPDGVDQARQLVSELASRIRQLSLDLRPTMLDDLGLVPALLWYLERYTAQTGVKVDFKHCRAERRFSSDVETAAYRMIQEALTNVARHSGADSAVVRLLADDEMLRIEVEDHGVGYDPDAVMRRGSTSGLAGMHERASLLGGRFAVKSSPGSGTRLTAVLPWRDSEQS